MFTRLALFLSGLLFVAASAGQDNLLKELTVDSDRAKKAYEDFQNRLNKLKALYSQAFDERRAIFAEESTKLKNELLEKLEAERKTATLEDRLDAAIVLRDAMTVIEKLKLLPPGEELNEQETLSVSISDNAVEFQGHSYALILEPETWHVAKAKCEALGGHLATYDSKSEERFANNLINHRWAWLGATDEVEEGNWKWINGDAARLYIERQPQHTVITGGHKKNFAHSLMRHGNDGKYVAELSGFRANYLCEWDTLRSKE